jgi:hypothetical protein
MTCQFPYIEAEDSALRENERFALKAIRCVVQFKNISKKLIEEADLQEALSEWPDENGKQCARRKILQTGPSILVDGNHYFISAGRDFYCDSADRIIRKMISVQNSR